MLDRDGLQKALTRVGERLFERGQFVELAIYGGSAIMMQFAWRTGTEDVDAVVRDGYDERVLGSVVREVAAEMGLEDDWMNDAVGMFTPLQEPEELFAVAGLYPSPSRPGLRVLLATPSYLLAMKLMAMANPGRGTKDLDDARHLAREVGITTEQALMSLYVSVHGEEPALASRSRFARVLET